MSIELIVRAGLLKMSPEERMSALRTFLKEQETIAEIPETGGQVFLHLSNLSGMWTSRVAVALPISAISSIFLLTSPTPGVSLLYFGGAILYFSLCWLIPHLLAKYHYRPLKVRRVGEWERDFVYRFSGSEGVRASEVPEDVLEQVFSVESGSIASLADRLLQNEGEREHGVYLQLRGRHERLRDENFLEEKKRDFVRVLRQALHKAQLSGRDEMLANVRLGDAFVSTFQLCESKVRALTVEIEGLLFPNGVPKDADPR